MNQETAWISHYEPRRATSLDMTFCRLRFGGDTGAPSGTFIIYADSCLMNREWLQERRIIFKKIPLGDCPVLTWN